MRLVWIVGALVAGCAHVEKTAIDYESHTFQLCGNKHAGADDFANAAEAGCAQGMATLLRCMQQTRGAMAMPIGRSAIAVPIHGTCCDYACR